MRRERPPFPPIPCEGPDGRYGVAEASLGDIVVLLLAGTLSGLRDRLAVDGFDSAADLVADLVDVADDYITNISPL